MSVIIKILKTIGILLLVLLLGFALFIFISGPTLPKETDEIVSNVLKSPVKDLVKGKTGIAKSQGLGIWFESIYPEDSLKGTVVLVMGISNDALGWPPKFIQAFVDSGYQVIRYDHRGTGMSDWGKEWKSRSPYSLADMADDAIAVLDALDVQEANIVGVSMGGMIAQEMAINHPERVGSLTSIMSSGFIEDPELPKISSGIAWNLIKISLKYGIFGGEKNMIKLHLASRILLKGTAIYEINIREVAEQVLYNLRKRNGYNPNVSWQHQRAVSLSGSRYEKLKLLTVPTLIVHGKNDPFIPIGHGRKCVEIIPDAQGLWLDEMGHDIPDNLVDTLTGKIIANFNRRF